MFGLVDSDGSDGRRRLETRTRFVGTVLAAGPKTPRADGIGVARQRPLRTGGCPERGKPKRHCRVGRLVPRLSEKGKTQKALPKRDRRLATSTSEKGKPQKALPDARHRRYGPRRGGIPSAGAWCRRGDQEEMGRTHEAIPVYRRQAEGKEKAQRPNEARPERRASERRNARPS